MVCCEWAWQTSLVSRPSNHLGRNNNRVCVLEKIPICLWLGSGHTDVMSAFMWPREKEKNDRIIKKKRENEGGEEMWGAEL